MTSSESHVLGARLLELVAVMDRLRSPGGCPWDAKQTHASLVEYLIEETYETVDAIDRADSDELKEELGDLLLQVVFHSRIAAETQQWDIDDVARGITDKLIRRHPHVFGDESAETAEDVEAQWQARKAVEKGRTSVTEGVPIAMPAIVQAAKLHGRARHGGVTVVPTVAGSVHNLLGPDATPDMVGDLLMAIVVEAEAQGIDADAAARAAVARFRTKILAIENEKFGR